MTPFLESEKNTHTRTHRRLPRLRGAKKKHQGIGEIVLEFEPRARSAKLTFRIIFSQFYCTAADAKNTHPPRSRQQIRFNYVLICPTVFYNLSLLPFVARRVEGENGARVAAKRKLLRVRRRI